MEDLISVLISPVFTGDKGEGASFLGFSSPVGFCEGVKELTWN